MPHTKSLISAALLASLALQAQQPTTAYDFRVVLQPGMTIGGHTFTADSRIESAALNDAGDVAFLCRWKVGQYDDSGVFTSDRIVVTQGAVFRDDGVEIVALPEKSLLAINGKQRVAYEGEYVSGEGEGLQGIFVEDHVVFARWGGITGTPFTLTDDGRVILKGDTLLQRSSTTKVSQKKQRILDRMRVKPPRLKNLPINISSDSQTEAEKAIGPGQNEAGPSLGRGFTFPVLAVNQRGQVLVFVKLGTAGFLLLLGTPVTQ